MRNVWLCGPTVAALAGRGARGGSAPGAFEQSSHAVSEPAPWTGLYGGLNAGYGGTISRSRKPVTPWPAASRS
jgi:hypothetical protein